MEPADRKIIKMTRTGDVTKLAIIGGSRAYDLLAEGSFGKGKKVRKIKTPFGDVEGIRRFEAKGLSFLFLSRHAYTPLTPHTATCNNRLSGCTHVVSRCEEIPVG